MEISGILGVLSKFLDAKSLFLPGANILKEAEADGPMKSTQNRDHRSYKIKYKNTICKYKKIFIYKYAISKHLKGCSGAKDDQTKDKNLRDDDLIQETRIQKTRIGKLIGRHANLKITLQKSVCNLFPSFDC